MRTPPLARRLLAPLLPLSMSAAVAAGAEIETVLLLDPQRPVGTDGAGNVLLYAPSPFEAGSSISHWDRTATPDLLMEPNASPQLPPLETGLAPALFEDLGWMTGGGARIELVFDDEPGEGFDHPRLGSARRTTLQAAVDAWSKLLSSPITIYVEADFRPLDCDDGTGVLAQAGTRFIFTDFAGAPRSRTWYPGALAESLSSQNLSLEDDPDPSSADLGLTFNSRIDEGCLGSGNRYHYGTDPAPAGEVSFVNVALHELAHGLGFQDLVNSQSGTYPQGIPGIFSTFVFDSTRGLHWAEMTASERVRSATNGPQVAWDGSRVRAAAPGRLDPGPSLRVESPPSARGSYLAVAADFGPPLTRTPLAGRLAEVDDGTSTPSLGCGPLVNAPAIAGRVALVDRGDCFFVEKVRHAEVAGAVAVVVVNNVAGLITMGGDDPGLGIPAVMVTRETGDLLRQALASDEGEEEQEEEEPGEEDPPADEGPSVCLPDDRQLCLAGGRFRVEATWRTPDGTSGEGGAQPITPDTGYFWFFRQSNVEAVVKVLDGCAVNGFFWVFAGGLSNVEVVLDVVDTETGRVRRYTNPQGNPFQPIQDTAAFETCP